MGATYYREKRKAAEAFREDLAMVRASVVLMGKVIAGIIEADVVDEVSDEEMNTAELSTAPTLEAIDRLLTRFNEK